MALLRDADGEDSFPHDRVSGISSIGARHTLLFNIGEKLMQSIPLPLESATGSHATWHLDYLMRGEDDEICVFGIVGRIQGEEDRRRINLDEEKFRKVCIEEGINFKEAWPLICAHPDLDF